MKESRSANVNRSRDPAFPEDRIAAKSVSAFADQLFGGRASVCCGTSRTSRDVRIESAKWAEAGIDQVAITKIGHAQFGADTLDHADERV